jgi:hypothetical protein
MAAMHDRFATVWGGTFGGSEKTIGEKMEEKKNQLIAQSGMISVQTRIPAISERNSWIRRAAPQKTARGSYGPTKCFWVHSH